MVLRRSLALPSACLMVVDEAPDWDGHPQLGSRMYSYALYICNGCALERHPKPVQAQRRYMTAPPSPTQRVRNQV